MRCGFHIIMTKKVSNITLRSVIFGTLVHASALTSYWGFPQSGACLPEARGRGGLTLSEARGGGGLLTSSARLVVPDPRATGEEGGCVARIEAAGNKPFPLSLSVQQQQHTHTHGVHTHSFPLSLKNMQETRSLCQHLGCKDQQTLSPISLCIY